MKLSTQTTNYFLASLVVLMLITTYISFNSPKSISHRDNAIVHQIKLSYQNHSHLHHIQVYSHNGKVKLIGHVQNEGQAKQALQLVQGIEGVKEIEHELITDNELIKPQS
jgi:osmotically-inducible protein OsmY